MAKKAVFGECGQSNGEGIEIDKSLLDILAATGLGVEVTPDKAYSMGYRSANQIADMSGCSVTTARIACRKANLETIEVKDGKVRSTWYRVKNAL